MKKSIIYTLLLPIIVCQIIIKFQGLVITGKKVRNSCSHKAYCLMRVMISTIYLYSCIYLLCRIYIYIIYNIKYEEWM